MTPPFSRQSTCVAIGGRAVLIEGPPGTGKSALALALIDRGATLIGDDSVLLSTEGDKLVAQPHPNTHGLLEVRNLGLLPFPVCESAPVALAVMLDADAPRYIEQAQIIAIGGVSVPCLRLWPDGGPLALKVELALARFGWPASASESAASAPSS
ncbi:HPr kinase [Novosphingobium sp. Rr 2-17]|uniref:HPr kinase/phosphorylase n=1 Tax=Novosphingobium sp. Rr 2-17 TaxID=555793 RepID=UPI0002698B6A|nr:HPr kinase/phosphatase C-terminal domain-containing protein [Novosphingobium sp. Rr 2-17]EIZ80574.1 HPr kinase [Novosphingobium sp. Rr 2-17]